MSSTFFGLELSRRALASQQIALDVTGHNIANANTQGYTRQVASFKPPYPDRLPGFGHDISLGTGVTLDYIGRARDNFVDRQFRWETSKQQYWAGKQDALQKVEGMFNEPSKNSLHDDLDKFWNSWSDLTKNAEN
ncbi:MAG: flagellar basal body protein, partial [Desulfitobacterium hafniense]|nr:flagellar basal body protein [Desulfitobacterium hafniense]